jgi:CRISPR-associated endonuclease Cas1
MDHSPDPAWERLVWRSLRLVLAPRRDMGFDLAPAEPPAPPSAGGSVTRFPVLPKLNALLKNVPASCNDPDPERPAVKRAYHVPGRLAHALRLRAGEAFPLEVLFFGGDDDTPGRWLEAFAVYAAGSRAGFELVEVGAATGQNGAELWSPDEAAPSHAELECLSPLPFKRAKGAPKTALTLETLFAGLRQRAKSLFGVELAPPPLDGVRLQPWYWEYREIPHLSKSQAGGHVQLYNGGVGPLYFAGELVGVLPWLRLAAAIHASGGVALNGLGYCRLHTPARPRFDLRLQDGALWHSALDALRANHDDWAEALAAGEGLPVDPKRYCRELGRRILASGWRPEPAQAFQVPKRDGTRRLEKLPFTEQLLHTGLHELLRESLDRVLTEAVFGYRRGRSAQAAAARVRELIAEGYRYVVEADIADFFPSVDLDRLDGLLDRLLPPADTALRGLLRRLLRAPYLEEGDLRPRGQGLAQGSPLSPLLANLYLGHFDEALLAAEAHLVRYADDFVMLARRREHAEALLERARRELAAVGLALGEDKTAIREVGEGFRFLGQAFGGPLPDDSLADLAARPTRKTLYLSEPYCYLGQNGDAVEIRAQGQLRDVLPLHGLEQIVVLGPAVFSSGLVRKCAALGIPLTFSLGGRRGMASVALDSRRHYTTARDHALHYARLSATERLVLAKAFASRKIENYRPLIAARYRAGHAELLHALERDLAGIEQATDTAGVRGHEGTAARRMYAALNDFIQVPEFHLPRRDREHPDPMNGVLNFGYHLLFLRLNVLVRGAGLNPYLGLLHDGDDDYESLVCDFEELFRAPVDGFLVKLVNLKIIAAADFHATPKGPRLNQDAVRRFLLRFEALLREDAGGVSLLRAMELQVDAFRRYVTEGRPLWLFRYKAPKPERAATGPGAGRADTAGEDDPC